MGKWGNGMDGCVWRREEREWGECVNGDVNGGMGMGMGMEWEWNGMGWGEWGTGKWGQPPLF